MGVRQLLRTNLVPNPQGKTGTADYSITFGTSGVGTLSVESILDMPASKVDSAIRRVWTTEGTAASQIAKLGVPVTAGTTYYAHNWVRRSGTDFTPTYDARILWYDAGNVLISTSAYNSKLIALPNQWYLVDTPAIVAPANATNCRVYSYSPASVHPVGAIIDVTGFFLSTEPGYFDGNSMETRDRFYKWTGMVHGSTSQEYSIVPDEWSPMGSTLSNLKQKMMEIVLGPNPVRTGTESTSDIKKAALEKLLGDNGLI